MRTVLITGANKGIGFETAKQLAGANHFVYLGCRDEQAGLEALTALHAVGLTNAAFIQLDVTDLDSVRQARQVLEEEAGSLDVLINNAGISGELPEELAVCGLNNLRTIFDTNFFGVVQTIQEFLPLLRRSERAAIINVSSEVGSLTGMSATGGNHNRDRFHAYGASKTALNAVTVMLANELRNTGISVNSVTPGHTATALNGFSGTKTVAEGAKPIVALAVKEGDFVTGKFFKDTGETSW